MRHLRRFNENLNLSKEEVDDFKKEVMELFQNVIDECDIEELPDYLEEHEECPGIFYSINDFPLTRLKDMPYIEIELYVGDKFIDRFKTMDVEIESFCSHLKSLGFKVKTNTIFSDYIGYLGANNGYSGEGRCSTSPFEIHIYYK